MGSRIRENPKNVFDCFLEVVSPQQENEEAWILQTFPSSYKTKEAERLKSVPQFAFPCKVSINTVQHFSFVLTNLEAKWTFGFCRYAPNSETAIVILSSLPWHEMFYKLLNKCAELTQHGDSGELWRFLEAVHSSKIPLSGSVFQVDYGSGNIFTSSTPNQLSLPSIPENRNLTEYFNAIDVQNMLILFASMLYERRILITSKKLARLSACVQASNAIIYPMSWQHIYIPVLPSQLLEYLYAPMPFLIGVPDVILKRVRRHELGDAVILDADNNKIETPFSDLETLPVEVVSNLKRSLKSPTQMLGDNVARAFLQALVHLIGGYRDALRYRQGEKITFNEDAFIMSRPSSLQPFLEQMLQLQLFRQFIEERLELLNSGQGFSDEFELECVAFTEKSNNKLKNQYTSITHNVRKEGGAIVKAVKNKANPAMKEVVRSVKDGSKIARDKVKDSSMIAKSRAKASYKDVKSKLKDNKDNSREDSNSSSRSAPSSPTQSRGSTLPRAPDSLHSSPAPPLTRNNTDLNFGTSRVLKYERFDPSEDHSRGISPEFEELPRLEYNFMNDLDEVIQRNRSESNLPAPPIHRASAEVDEFSPKASVGDLIKLETSQDDTEFDPLVSKIATTNSNTAFNRTYEQVIPGSHIHKPLARTANPFVAPPNHSSGKYENYVPPGGTSTPQFRQFLASMTDTSHNNHNLQQGSNGLKPSMPSRSSDDLLNEYGLDFKLNLNSPSQNLNAGYRSTMAAPNTNFHLNGNIPDKGTSSIPNSSFLYTSAASSAFLSRPAMNAPNSTMMPVNQRVSLGHNQVAGFDLLAVFPSTNSPVPATSSPLTNVPQQSCRDILADLDPLRSSAQDAAASLTKPKHSLPSAGTPSLQPPSVPRRTKKQWTTFD